MPNNDAVIAIQNLKLDSSNLDLISSDSSSGIDAPKKIEQVTFSQDSKGRYEQDTQEVKTDLKKDVESRADELNEYEVNVVSFTNLAKISDNKLLNIATQINEKKQLIITKISQAVSAGCSVGIGSTTAIVNGIVLGVGNTIVNDYAYIKKYSGLDNYSSTNPFASEDTLTLSSSNSGTGYFSGFTENAGSVVGTYRTVFNYPLLPATPPTICATCMSEVQTLASEINTLRSQIDNALISNSNSIKDKKTESEIFVWGYKSREKKASSIKQSNNSIIDTINNESSFQ